LLMHLETIEHWNGPNQQYRDVFMDYVIKQSPHRQVSNPGE